ncbi:hypothetical protein CYY_006497 [Polysphondylium violaceum]|uniref:Tetratricopeptide-like helical domain-containing protein n=1 Tax=Polysphondylium violaceum TaxID=133409 RepID=A0A8J4PQR4_9MYCE|nr:hypothetical protein CYY_006497 [Polysphondylium violaceum]
MNKISLQGFKYLNIFKPVCVVCGSIKITNNNAIRSYTTTNFSSKTILLLNKSNFTNTSTYSSSNFNKFSRSVGSSRSSTGQLSSIQKIIQETEKSNGKSKEKEDENQLKINTVNPQDAPLFIARPPPYECTTDLEFMVLPDQKKITDIQTIERYLNLAKGLSAVGYEHQEKERWQEALESYNKALLYVRNVFASDKTKIDLRDYAVLLTNSAESLTRLEKDDEALIRSKQAVDLMEVHWREFYKRHRHLTNRTHWLGDEFLGIAYYNYAEGLCVASRYFEAEPFIKRAQEICNRIYPLDHPVNVDIASLLIKVLNENHRGKEAGKAMEKFYPHIEKTLNISDEEKQAMSEKIDKDLEKQVVELFKQQYPEIEFTEEELNTINLEQDIKDQFNIKEKEKEEKVVYPTKYKEHEFDVEDLLLVAQEEFEERQSSVAKSKQQEDAAQHVEQDFEDEDVQDLKEEFREDEYDYEEDDDLDVGEYEMDPREKYLQEKAEEEERLRIERGETLFSPKEPLGETMNLFDQMLTETADKYEMLRDQRELEMEQRILGRKPKTMDQISYEDNRITSKTDKYGNPLNPDAIDKLAQYQLEDDLKIDQDQEDEVLEDTMERMADLMDKIPESEHKLLDAKMKHLFPALEMIMKSGDPSKYLNTSHMDQEEDLENFSKMMNGKFQQGLENFDQDQDYDGEVDFDQWKKELMDIAEDEDDDRDDDDVFGIMKLADEGKSSAGGNKKSTLQTSFGKPVEPYAPQAGSSGGSMGLSDLSELLDSVNKHGFDEDALIKSMGHSKFKNLENHYLSQNDYDDDDDDAMDPIELQLSKAFSVDKKDLKNITGLNKKQKSQLEELFEDDDDDQDDDDDEYDDDESYDFDFDDMDEDMDLDDIDLDELDDSKSPENDLQKYLKKSSSSKKNDVQDLLQLLNEKKKK